MIYYIKNIKNARRTLILDFKSSSVWVTKVNVLVKSCDGKLEISWTLAHVWAESKIRSEEVGSCDCISDPRWGSEEELPQIVYWVGQVGWKQVESCWLENGDCCESKGNCLFNLRNISVHAAWKVGVCCWCGSVHI